jgi:ABC-2 type transport system ATP-binding protein
LIGVVPDESNLYPELTGFDNLCFCAALYGMGKRDRQARARELLDTFGLTQAAERKFGVYSKGMKRKLTIAAGIIHKPAILFLDEPTTGIDIFVRITGIEAGAMRRENEKRGGGV